MGLAQRLKQGLERSREALNEVFYLGGEVDEQFWEDLEDSLVMADVGAEVAMKVTDDLRELAARQSLRTDRQLREALAERLAQVFPHAQRDPFSDLPSCVLFVGINGAGKTTTVGKLAAKARDANHATVLGAADTFRAAAIEQLEIWGERAGVKVVTRERGADPASVCYDVLEAAERDGDNLVLIDTAGRLHTSPELMRELAKVVSVTRRRSDMPVSVVLVVDATTVSSSRSSTVLLRAASLWPSRSSSVYPFFASALARVSMTSNRLTPSSLAARLWAASKEFLDVR